jgi:uncharacterized protein YndB with AHSA1/START domain
MAARNKPNEIYLTRIYDAPVKLVWEAWNDPKQCVQWWGPRGFTFTNHGKELRPGGKWRYTMHGPDGKDWPNVTLYHEVEEYKKLVYDHGGTDDTPPMFRVTVLFTDVKGKTQLDFTMAFISPEVANETKKFIKAAGGNATWDRLAEYLDKTTKGKETFVINREFEAPVETVWNVWTDPKHFEKWLPPTGFQMEFIKADIRTGGKTFYVMFNDTGMKMYGRAEYLEVRRPDRLVYTQQFCDEKENVSRHPMAPTWPETMQTTVTFTAEDANRTRVTIEWEVVGKVTIEEMDTFTTGRAGMTMGWTGSFDKLEDYLSTLK